jgi:hypothetical protein
MQFRFDQIAHKRAVISALIEGILRLELDTKKWLRVETKKQTEPHQLLIAIKGQILDEHHMDSIIAKPRLPGVELKAVFADTYKMRKYFRSIDVFREALPGFSTTDLILLSCHEAWVKIDVHFPA